MKADPAHAETMSFTENGDRYSMYFLQARVREDLRRRTRCHKMIADMTFGLFGRSPDHVASYVTATAMNPQVFDTATRAFAGNATFVRRRPGRILKRAHTTHTRPVPCNRRAMSAF